HTQVAPSQPAPAAHRRTLLPLVFAGGAIGFLGGAAGFARWGDRTYDRAKAAADLSTQLSLWHSANQKRYAAEAMLGAGVGCAGVAVWSWLRGRSEAPTSSAAGDRDVTVTPVVGPDAVGVVLGRSW